MKDYVKKAKQASTKEYGRKGIPMPSTMAAKKKGKRYGKG